MGLCSSMVLSLAASWGDCGGGLAPRVPSLKELMALPCTMQPRRLMNKRGRAPRLFIRHLCSSMVLSLAASWGDCEGGLAPRVPSFKELMALPCTMQSCRLMQNCGRAPHLFIRRLCLACALPWCSPWLQVGEIVEDALLQGCQASKSSWSCHAPCNHATS